MSTKSSGGGGRRRGGRRRQQPMAEINVTPFVDVMLVLLIIFMVAAPLLSVGVPIELPKSSAQQLGQSNKAPLTITVAKDGKLFLMETPVDLSEIRLRLSKMPPETAADPIYIRGDKDVDYGMVMRVMGELSAAGFGKISLVTDVEPKT
ncbi:MAG: protein TolR [Hyphomicrobiaceae bacterium]